MPAALRTTWEREYPFAWLGVLADVAPSTDELIYAWHPNGFALNSMRSATVTRLYLQVDPAERLEDVVAGTGATIAVIATPAEVAQEVLEES